MILFANFKMFCLSLVLSNFIRICFGIVSFLSLTLGVHQASWICGFIFFINLGGKLVITFSMSPPLLLSFACFRGLQLHIGHIEYMMYSHGSLILGSISPAILCFIFDSFTVTSSRPLIFASALPNLLSPSSTLFLLDTVVFTSGSLIWGDVG